MSVAEVRWLTQLEDENAKLKRLVADLNLDKAIVRDVLRKGLTPASAAGYRVRAGCLPSYGAPRTLRAALSAGNNSLRIGEAWAGGS
jgi:putative transposase